MQVKEGQDAQGDREEGPIKNNHRYVSKLEVVVSKTHLDEFTESEVKEKTTTISTRPCTHLRDFKIRHLANDLPRIKSSERDCIKE